MASVSCTKVGRKKKKQIKKQLGEQARGETFKSLLKKHFVEQFKEVEFGRPYNIKPRFKHNIAVRHPLKGVKVLLMYARLCVGVNQCIEMEVYV